MHHERWRRALVAATVMFVAVGVALAAAGDTRAFALYDDRVVATFFGGALPAGGHALLRTTFAILGGAIAAKWALMIWFARVPLARRERWAHRASLAALLAWFAVDSTSSVARGAAFNVAMVNVFALAIAGALLVALAPSCDVAVAPRRGTGPALALLGVLAALALAVAVLGLAVVPPLHAAVARAFPDPGSAAFVRFGCGLIGGTIVGHLVLIAAAVRYAGRAGAIAVLVSLLVWLATTLGGLAAHGTSP